MTGELSASTPGGDLVAVLRAEIERLAGELAQAQAQIAELVAHADVDPLLGILNRRGFERELARSLAHIQRYGTPAVLIYIDLDGFKTINDVNGHAAGDALLKEVTAALGSHVRASDAVGRLGGDEFGIILWHSGEAQAATKAGDLETIIAGTAVVRGTKRLSVGASAGSVLLRPGLEPAALIDAADKAMYRRKKARRP